MDYNKSTFESVIRKSIKTFKKGQIPEQTFEAMSSDGKEVKYTPCLLYTSPSPRD